MEAKCKPQATSRAAIVDLVTSTLSEIISEEGEAQFTDLGEGTCLIGARSVVSSLGLVSLVVELEQILEEEHGITVTLADERAMSREHSPFRTVGSLADYICQLAPEGGTNDRS